MKDPGKEVGQVLIREDYKVVSTWNEITKGSTFS